MPEGDTIYRTAVSLHRTLGGRALTGARGSVPDFPCERLVGKRIETVEARGKHLLVRLDSGEAVHSHMGMTGAWHLYPSGERWRRPERQARLVLEADDRVAVCFNAPVVELLSARAELRHPALAGLGPDILAEPLALEQVRGRVRTLCPEAAVGEVLLDQRVAAGIGNVFRCEALFVEGVHPWTSVASLDDDALDGVFRTAARLMRANLGDFVRDFGGGRDRPWVYRRASRPCRRCGARIESRRQGEHARAAYWCPQCQPRDCQHRA
jgi:endonuclease VIII